MIYSDRSFFAQVLLTGIILVVIFLLCRECFNWYIKHNSMLDELKKIEKESRQTNQVLGEIQKELTAWRVSTQDEPNDNRQSSRVGQVSQKMGSGRKREAETISKQC